MATFFDVIRDQVLGLWNRDNRVYPTIVGGMTRMKSFIVSAYAPDFGAIGRR